MAVPPFTIQLPPLTLSNVGKMRSDGVWIEQMWLIIIWWRRYAATLPTTRPSPDMIRIILIIIWWCILIIRYWWYFIWWRRYAATSEQICRAICALWSIPWEVSFNLQNKTLCDEAKFLSTHTQGQRSERRISNRAYFTQTLPYHHQPKVLTQSYWALESSLQ